jgi:hypothetical protein
MTARMVNKLKYIALLDDNELKLTSLNDCIYYTLRVRIGNTTENETIKASNVLALFNKTNDNEYINITDDLNSIKKYTDF